MSDKVDVIIIGAGQAGLAAGYYMMQQNRNFVILEQSDQVGQSWRLRWDSLKLITPNPYNNLPGLPFPKISELFPTREEMIRYLEQYTQAFHLPIQYNQTVKKLQQIDKGYSVETDRTTLRANQVIVATGAYQKPFIPEFSQNLSPEIFQLHSSQYRNPQSLPSGAVLVVGSGNSGVPIAKELSTSHKVYLSCGSTPSVPRTLWGKDLFWWLYTLKVTRLNINSQIGKRLSQRPDVRVGFNLKRLAAESGVILRGRTTNAIKNRFTFDSSESITINTVIWATGFRSAYPWIHVPVFDSQGRPIHQRGITSAPGLYFLGLRWQHRITSSLIGGVGEDAAVIAEDIEVCYSAQINPYSS